MTDLISWVGSPQAYNWITLLGALAAIMTAAFTGYSASTQWLDRKKRVKVDWDLAFDNLTPRITAHILNHADFTIIGCSAKILGPVAVVSAWKNGRSFEKHPSFLPNEAFAMCAIDRGAAGSVSFSFQPEPEMLRKLASSRSSGIISSLAKFAWSSLGWTIPCGVKFSIRLTLRRRSSHILPRRLTHTIRINPVMAMKIAANIENKADKT